MQSNSSRDRRRLAIAGLALFCGGMWVGDRRVIADSPANRMARWTGWGWSEGYHSAAAERDPRAGLPPIGYSSQKFRDGLFQPIELARPQRQLFGGHHDITTDAFASAPYLVDSYDVGPSIAQPSGRSTWPGTSGSAGASVLNHGSPDVGADHSRPRLPGTGPATRAPQATGTDFQPKGGQPIELNKERTIPSPSDRQPRLRETPGGGGGGGGGGQNSPPPLVPPFSASKGNGFDQRGTDESTSFDDAQESTWQRFLRLSSEEWFPGETDAKNRFGSSPRNGVVAPER